ncbi:MAG TPA: hypothetical protein VFK06_24450, partial [Candidatus Angelobacter sp.]|nr:hypothetical protein [Candidatus Angelobacter sp.]
QLLLTLLVAFGFPFIMMLVPVCQAAQSEKPSGETHEEDEEDDDIPRFVPPAVFQAAGPKAASIQSTVDEFRAALGDNNGSVAAMFPSGRREINWDGGNPNVTATTDPVTPFNVFLNNRGAQFTTPGTGLSQAPPSGPLPLARKNHAREKKVAKFTA